MSYRTAMMMGRLTDGAQADHGRLVHVVTIKSVKPRKTRYNDYGRDLEKMAIKTAAEVSLCGKRPGPRSVGWSPNGDGAPTCHKCIARAETQDVRWCNEHEKMEVR